MTLIRCIYCKSVIVFYKAHSIILLLHLTLLCVQNTIHDLYDDRDNVVNKANNEYEKHDDENNDGNDNNKDDCVGIS